ncbi:ComEA family DNA-binding protein, partial [Kocuria tytonicola]|uniref:ComEA family DNA-binding protein n=1 Tax=Kocuria tytonicola TaxID=2055946 RepID=UPI001981B213
AGATSGAPGGSSSGGTASDKTTSGGGVPGPSGSAGAPSAGSTGGVLTVHVVGEVRDPSVVTLSPGARVMDAVEAAGGFTPAAVKDRINLAENVADGAQIVIPNRGNVDEVLAARTAPGGGSGGSGAPAPNAASRPAGATNGAPEPGARGGGSTAAAPGAPVNLNTATEAELEALPKVGPVLAQRIVEFRTQHGPFTSPEQLDDVSGVGPAMLEALLPLVTV